MDNKDKAIKKAVKKEGLNNVGGVVSIPSLGQFVKKFKQRLIWVI